MGLSRKKGKMSMLTNCTIPSKMGLSKDKGKTSLYTNCTIPSKMGLIVQFLVGGIKSISAFLEEVTKICTQVQFLMLNKVERATWPKNGMAFFF